MVGIVPARITKDTTSFTLKVGLGTACCVHQVHHVKHVHQVHHVHHACHPQDNDAQPQGRPNRAVGPHWMARSRHAAQQGAGHSHDHGDTAGPHKEHFQRSQDEDQDFLSQPPTRKPEGRLCVRELCGKVGFCFLFT